MALLKRFIILILLCGTSNSQYSIEGDCSRNRGSQFQGVDVDIKVCCSNYEDRNGRCEACSVGFTSEVGSTCKPCPSGWYGIKCIMECDCTGKESCNHLGGCELNETKSDSEQKTQERQGGDQGQRGNDEKGGDQGNEVLVYMACVGAIGILVVVVFALWKCRAHMFAFRSRSADNRVSPLNMSKRHEVDTLCKMNKSAKKRETTYDIINEKYMVKSLDKLADNI